MLKIRAGWDWFYEEFTPEEKAAFDKKQICAVVQEDGDDNAAIVSAVKGVDAPEEFVELETLDPCVADCFLAVAWDKRHVEVLMEGTEGYEEEEDDEL